MIATAAIAAGGLPAAAFDAGHELSMDVSVYPPGPLKICVGDSELFTFEITSRTENLNAPSQPIIVQHGGLTPTQVTIRNGNSVVWTGETSRVTKRIRFDRVGTTTVSADAPPPRLLSDHPDAISGHAAVSVDVVRCDYEIEVRSLWHMPDGFQPVMASVIDRTRMVADANGEYRADLTATNAAVAFPLGGCVPKFTVSDARALAIGRLSADLQTFELGIVWSPGSTRLAGTGVRCLVVGGGTTDAYEIGPLRTSIPAIGRSTHWAPLLPHALRTAGRQIMGTTWVTLRRIEP